MTPEQQKWVGIVVGIGAAIFCYVYFLYLPISKQVGELSVQLETKKKELEDAKIKVKEMEKLKAQNVDLEKDLNFTRKRLAKTDDQPGIIKEISRVAAEKNVTVSSFEFQKTVAGAKPFYSEIPIKMVLKSDFANFGEFLTKLGYATRLISCTDCQFALNTDMKGSSSITVMLKAFVLTNDLESSASTGKDEVNERAIEPLYRFTRSGSKDPFRPLSGGEVQLITSEVNIASLRLESVIVLGKSRMAIFEDGSNVPYYLIGAQLFDKEKKNAIKNIVGSFEGGKVELKQTDPVTGSVKQRQFEIIRTK